MRTKTRAYAMTGAAFIALSYAATACGQSASPGAAPSRVPDANALAEVIVTAQRRSENLQKVPISVTSFTATALAAQQVSSTLDLARLVPNMFSSNNVGTGSANVYYIRGLGQTQSFPTYEPQVTTYVDDIPIVRQNANNLALFGVQQLQVLNGPQGTLFGRNAAGGAIVVELQKPSALFGGTADLSYGSFSAVNGRASVDLPISDQIRTRTSFFAVTDDGYVQDITTHQSLNATHDYGVREAVSLLPSSFSRVEWVIAADYEHNDSANVVNFPSDTGGVNGSDRISYSGFNTRGGALEGFLTGAKATFGQGVVVQSIGVSSNFKVAFDAGTLNVISGFRGLNQSLGVDFPGPPIFGPLVPYDQVPTGEFALAQALRSHQVTQEVKWTGSVGGRLKYTAGAFFLFDTNSDSYGRVINLAAPIGFGTYIPATSGDEFTKNQTTSEAVYAQGDFAITPKLTFTLGGRFTHEAKSVTAMPNQPNQGFTTADIVAAGYSPHLDANEFTPRIALQYQLDPDVMVFASATRGFQGGGWDGLAFTGPTFNTFGPETIWSYETGFRSETPDHRFRLNTTFFYQNVDQYQLLSIDTALNTTLTTNAANMAAYGLEAQLSWLPIDHLTLGANIGMIKAAYYDQSAAVRTQQANCLAGVDVANNCDDGIVRANGALASPVETPALSAALSASYDFIFPTFKITLNASVQYTAREWFDTANTSGAGEALARTLLDLGLTYQPDDLPFTISIQCKNCTVVNYGVYYLLGLDYYNAPGTWNVSLHYKFR